jgi:hypothetical protein
MTTLSDLMDRMIQSSQYRADDETPTAPTYYCRECDDNTQVSEPGDLCPKCVIEKTQGYKVRSLAGRCANGAELDHGTRNHTLIGDTWTAACGAKPGRRSVGWVMPWPDRTATCPRCLKKLEAKRAAWQAGDCEDVPTPPVSEADDERNSRPFPF